MKIVIIGGVAGGASAATRLRRMNEDNEIIMFERSDYISFANCGLPYHIGETIKDRNNLLVQTVKGMNDRFGIDVRVKTEIVKINPSLKTVLAKNLVTGETYEESYDKLLLSPGAEAFIPPIPGVNSKNIFSLRNMSDMDKIKGKVDSGIKRAVVIGAGFIGLEIAENLVERDVKVTIVEKSNQVLAPVDFEIASQVHDHIKEFDTELYLEDGAKEFIDIGDKTKVILESGKEIIADLVIMAIGVKPENKLAMEAGLEIGKTGGIKVDEYLQTSDKDIYAVGDICEHKSLIDGSEIYRPLGSTANKMGRILGDVLTGKPNNFRGVLGTSIFKVFDMAVAYTGFTENEARRKGYDVEVIHNLKEDKSIYLSESRQIVIKAIADRKTEKLLGVQIVGEAGVDKRIDVFVTAITFGAKVSDLFHLDLAYAPPFSTTKDPVMYTGMILDNAMNHNRPVLTVAELKANREKYTVIDVRSEKDFEKGHIEGALNIPLGKIRTTDLGIAKDTPIVCHCNKGTTGNAGQNLFINLGYTEVYNLSGGYKNYAMQKDL